MLLWCLTLTALAADPAPEADEAGEAHEVADDDGDDDDDDDDDEEAQLPPLVMPETGRLTLPEVGALPSALDDTTAIDDPDNSVEGLFSLMDEWKDERRAVWGGRNIVRPMLSLRVHDSGAPVQLGLALGRQWWQLREGPKLAIEAVLAGEATLASGLGSWSTDLTVLAGSNVGPLGFGVGPSFVGERTVLGPVDLGTVGAVAPVGQLTIDLKVVQLFGGAATRFFVAGDRASAPESPIGDEPLLRAGAGLGLGPLRFTLDWTGRWTVEDRVDRYAVGVRFRL